MHSSLQQALATAVVILTAAAAFGQSAQIGLNFTGTTLNEIAQRDGFVLLPPDTMGAVGPSNIVEFINSDFAVYHKSNGSLNGSRISDSTFWQNAGLSLGNVDLTDPRVLYDPASQHWFAIEATVPSSGANDILVGVSHNSDPTRGWNAYSFTGDTSSSHNFADFPTLGIDSNGLYISANMFNSSQAFVGVSVYGISKSQLIAGSAVVNSARNLSASTYGATIQPAVNFGPSPSGREPMLAGGLGGAGQFKRTDVIGLSTTGTTPSLTSPVSINTSLGMADPPPAQQFGTTNTIKTNDSRISANVVRSNTSLWAVQDTSRNIAGRDRAVVNYFQIDQATNRILRSGVISDPNLDLYYPSIAVNARGDVVIGFSGSGANEYPGSYAVVGKIDPATTGLNSISFGNLMLLKAGVAPYNDNRWGDYSTTVVDPTDPNVFWTFQEFAPADTPLLSTNNFSNWAVQITRIEVPEPTGIALMLAVFAGLLLPRTRRRVA